MLSGSGRNDIGEKCRNAACVTTAAQRRQIPWDEGCNCGHCSPVGSHRGPLLPALLPPTALPPAALPPAALLPAPAAPAAPARLPQLGLLLLRPALLRSTRLLRGALPLATRLLALLCTLSALGPAKEQRAFHLGRARRRARLLLLLQALKVRLALLLLPAWHACCACRRELLRLWQRLHGLLLAIPGLQRGL